MSVIQVQREEQVVWITLNRPQALNALNNELLTELQKTIEQIEQDDSVGAVVVTGNGERAFVAGADIKEIQSLNAESAELFAQYGQKIFRKLELLNVPVIACVNGFALGGGLELALSCDFIYCSESAKFGLPEVSLGLIPGFGGTQRLSRVIGLARAREMIYSGRMLSAPEALQWGLVNKVCALSDLHAAVDECLKLILSRGPQAVAMAKKTINEGYDQTLDEGLRLESAGFSSVFRTGEPHEGTSAFIEKRAPQFHRS